MMIKTTKAKPSKREINMYVFLNLQIKVNEKEGYVFHTVLMESYWFLFSWPLFTVNYTWLSKTHDKIILTLCWIIRKKPFMSREIIVLLTVFTLVRITLEEGKYIFYKGRIKNREIYVPIDQKITFKSDF